MAKFFLSHNHSDKSFVRILASDLKSFGIDSWVDEAEMSYGESLIEKIQNSIENVDYVLVILSENSIKSNWVKVELEMALTLEIEGKRNFVIPLVIDNVEIPLILKRKKYLSCKNQRSYKLGIGSLVEFIRGSSKPELLTAGQAFERIRKHDLDFGGIIAISQQGLLQTVHSQHILLRNLVYRDSFTGQSRYWVFETFNPKTNLIETATVTDGKVNKLPVKVVSEWASESQKLKAEFMVITKEGLHEKRLRSTKYKPQLTTESFTDSINIHNELFNKNSSFLLNLSSKYFQNMLFYYNEDLKQFIWSIQFFDFFTRMPKYIIDCDSSGNILRTNSEKQIKMINQEAIKMTATEKNQINLKLSTSLVSHILTRNSK